MPYYRSGLLVRFDVKRSASALLELRLDDGDPMPLGAVVTLEGAAAEFPVAERGEVFVTGLSASNRLRATWRGGSCDFAFDLPADAGPQPRIGPIRCSGLIR